MTDTGSEATMATNGLKPCPKCNNEVQGVVTGGQAAYGCGEYGYQIECTCGIMFDTTRSYETPEEAEAEGIKEWNIRYKRTCHLKGRVGGLLCSECGVFINNDCIADAQRWIAPRYCPSCGAEVV